jgi:hypothetical protein
MGSISPTVVGRYQHYQKKVNRLIRECFVAATSQDKRYDLAQIGLPAADRPDHSGRGRGGLGEEGGGDDWGCIPVGSISPSEGIAPRVE